MNWKRGAFRLWVVCSAGWATFMIWQAGRFLLEGHGPLPWQFFAWLIGPPIAVAATAILLYGAVIWVWRGLAEPQQSGARRS